MRRAKRNAAKLLSAAMAVGMMAGMAVPAAAEEESNNIWASRCRYIRANGIKDVPDW